jgi:hypothetical protein
VALAFTMGGYSGGVERGKGISGVGELQTEDCKMDIGAADSACGESVFRTKRGP